jgi:hypothetical protein
LKLANSAGCPGPRAAAARASLAARSAAVPDIKAGPAGTAAIRKSPAAPPPLLPLAPPLAARFAAAPALAAAAGRARALAGAGFGSGSTSPRHASQRAPQRPADQRSPRYSISRAWRQPRASAAYSATALKSATSRCRRVVGGWWVAGGLELVGRRGAVGN